jgi:hypothetical protein
VVDARRKFLRDQTDVVRIDLEVFDRVTKQCNGCDKDQQYEHARMFHDERHPSLHVPGEECVDLVLGTNEWRRRIAQGVTP